MLMLRTDCLLFTLKAAHFSRLLPAGQSPAVKQQIVDRAMNASGMRDTARVLHVSPTTVIKELKKRT